jgi:hypothetical protein
MIFPRHLDRAFEGFRAGVREEDGVGESRLDETAGELFLTGNAVDVRGMPDLPGLLGKRLDEMGMGMASFSSVTGVL